MSLVVSLMVLSVIAPPRPRILPPMQVTLVAPRGGGGGGSGGTQVASAAPARATPAPIRPTPAPARATPATTIMAPTPRPTPRATPLPAAQSTPQPQPTAAPRATPRPTPQEKRVASVAPPKQVVDPKTQVKELATPTPRPTAPPRPTPQPRPAGGDAAAASPTPQTAATPRAAEAAPTPASAPAPAVDTRNLPTTPTPGAGPRVAVGNLAVESGAGGGGGGIADVGQAYFGLMLSKLQENFKPPITPPGVICRVRFTILRDGTIRNPQLVASVNQPPPNLIMYAMQAIERTRLPALYEGIRENSLDVIVTFDYERNH